MNLVFSNQTQKKIPRSHLENVAQKLQRYLVRKGHRPQDLKKDLILVFLPLEQVRALNARFRNKDYATDVLSFQSDDPESLGELVFSPEVLQRQALENGHSFRWELTYMMIHGVLHLLGYEHEKSSRRAQEMYRLQDEFFERLRS